MSTAKIWTCLGLCALVATACDDDKKAATAQPEAAPPPAATSAPAPAPTPTPAPAPTVAFKKRTVADCKPKTVDFNDDAALEAQVRLKTSKATGPVTPADLATVKSINLSQSKDMHQIDPCLFPMMTSLKDVFLGTGDYDDLTPLAKIGTLESLRISGSQVKDLHPIEGLKRMDRLDISHTQVTDESLKSIAGLVNVTELMLDDDNVSDLTSVTPMKKLEKLSIKNTQVKNLSPVSQIKTLKYLYINGSPISDISPVQPLMSNGMKLVQN